MVYFICSRLIWGQMLIRHVVQYFKGLLKKRQKSEMVYYSVWVSTVQAKVLVCTLHKYMENAWIYIFKQTRSDSFTMKIQKVKKGKAVPVDATDMYRGSGSVPPITFNLGTRYGWVITDQCCTLISLNPGKEPWYLLNKSLVRPTAKFGYETSLIHMVEIEY
jgi:hypothetical protein